VPYVMAVSRLHARPGTVNGTVSGVATEPLLYLSQPYSERGVRVGVRETEIPQEAESFVDEMANFIPDKHRPYVGESAFAIKGASTSAQFGGSGDL